MTNVHELRARIVSASSSTSLTWAASKIGQFIAELSLVSEFKGLLFFSRLPSSKCSHKSVASRRFCYHLLISALCHQNIQSCMPQTLVIMTRLAGMGHLQLKSAQILRIQPNKSGSSELLTTMIILLQTCVYRNAMIESN